MQETTTPEPDEGQLDSQPCATDSGLCVGIFKALDLEVRERFAELGAVIEYPRGAALTKQGEPQELMAVVLDGSVSVSCHAHGDIIHLADIGVGGMVGEMSLIDRQPASADVIVTTKSATVWTLRYEDFDKFLVDDPKASVQVYQIIATELCRLLRCNSEHMLQDKDRLRSHFLDQDY